MSDFNSELPVRSENLGSLSTRISDGAIPSQQLTVNNDGSVNITDNGGSLTVDGTVSISGDVNVTQGTSPWVISSTDLDIRDLSATQDNVAISDGTDTLAVNADGSINAVISATDLDIRDLAFATDKVDVSGSDVTVSNTITVQSTDLDIRDLSALQDNVAISDGTDTLAVNTDGSINVVVQEDVGTEIVNYNTAASIAAGATSNHDWTSAAASKLYQVFAAASGKMKIEVQIETGAATGTFNTVAVGFNSTANPNIDLRLAKYAAVPSGARVRVIRRNNDNQSQDLYSTIVAIQG